MILMLQIGLKDISCNCICVINLWSVDFLERFHRANGADKLNIGVVTEQVTKKVKRQRGNTVGWHKVAHLKAHFFEILFCQGRFIWLVFYT